MTLGTTMTPITASTGITWTRDEIVAKFRKLTGLSTTTDISAQTAADVVNDWYVNQFPLKTGIAEFESEKTITISATDTGSYDLTTTTLTIDKPALLDGSEIAHYHDKTEFEADYPDDEDYITAPTLAIGTSSAAAVANSAFTYKGSDGWQRAKAAAETALSGDTVPQNLYGAWGLSISDAGTVTITEADDNATGYATAALAINGIAAPSSGYAAMGFVTVISTDAAGFVPGTTLLSDAAVTDTYTDGNWDLRGTPTAVMVMGGAVLVRPKSDDAHILRIPFTCQRPTALSAGSSTLPDASWGLAIAAGAAAHYCADTLHDDDAATRALAILDTQLTLFSTKKWRQWHRSGREVMRES